MQQNPLVQHRLTRRTAAIALALVSAGACGGSSEGASADDVPDACTRAAAGFANAPEPVDAPAQERFLSTARSAVREAGSVMRDAAADSTDANLKEMSRLVDAFPQVIGNWTVSEVAWRARATVMRLDELAQQMGVPACGAAT